MIRLDKVLRIIFISLFMSNKASALGFFYKTEVKTLSTELTITHDVLKIEINPALKIKNKVQYILLFVKDANAWKRDEKSRELVDPSGKKIDINVTIQNQFGKTYRLSEVSFGKALMFSFCCLENKTTAETDLPAQDSFTKLLISSSRALKIEKIEWHDLLNK